jgi:streptogrisin C
MRRETQTLSTLGALLMGFVSAGGWLPSAHAASPEMQAAMRRDLGLTELQVQQRQAFESQAAMLEGGLRDALGEGFGGAWLSAEGTRLVVGITDPAQEALVRRAGAEPRRVTWSLAQLEEAKAALDREAWRTNTDIRAWYVDVPTNSVVIEVAPSTFARAQANSFITSSGALARAIRLETSAQPVELRENLLGGEVYYTDFGHEVSRCSIGFSVKGGFVTAGHCGDVGRRTFGFNWMNQGVVNGSVFPVYDMAWVQTHASWTPTPWVNRYNRTGVIQINGSQDRSIFWSSTCRSGTTTGWRCGIVTGTDMTVNYTRGTVYGLTRTTACSEIGDSGGSFIADDQAQGVTSGGNGDCTSGGTTYFQPVNPILAAYRLSLMTAGTIQPGLTAFTALHSGQCLDVYGANGDVRAPVVQHPCNYGANQQFRLVPSDSGYYRLIASHSGQCLDVYGANNNSKAPVVQHPCNGGLNQQFSIEYLGSPGGDVVQIRARHSGMCLDVDGANSKVAAKLMQHACHGGANQQFVIR